MWLPDPSILGPGVRLGGLPPEASIHLQSNLQYHHCPSHTYPPAVLPANLPASEFLIIPPYDPTQPETRTQYARRFDEVIYGDSRKKVADNQTRFVLNNSNGVSRDGLYDHLTEYLMELIELGVDVIQLPKANVDWRHPNGFKKCRKAVTSVFRHAKRSTSSSTKRTTTSKLPGGRIFETGRDEIYG
jgi:hypothetical protein